MLKLCGFAASNYYNKVKLALIEKGLDFEEQLVWTDQTDKAASPLGKVPYLLTEDGPVCESEVIVSYLEARYPAQPLTPADPYQAAKVNELVTFLELHLELVARNLFPEAYFGGKVSDATKEKVGQQLEKNIAALARLVKFSPFIAGDSFTRADCAAAAHFPTVMGATKIIYGRDLYAQLPIRAYLEHVNQRPSMQRVNADRKVNTVAMMARYKAAA